MPITERGQLLDFFIRQKQAALHPARLELAAAARRWLLTHSFPVNMRELEDLVEMCYLFNEPGQHVQVAAYLVA